MLNYSVSHKCHTPHPFYFPPIPVPALSVRQAAYAAYPHTPPLRSGVFRYSTVRLTNLVRCDHLAAPNGSVRKMNAPSVRLAILSHLTRLHSLKTVGFRSRLPARSALNGRHRRPAPPHNGPPEISRKLPSTAVPPLFFSQTFSWQT